MVLPPTLCCCSAPLAGITKGQCQTRPHAPGEWAGDVTNRMDAVRMEKLVEWNLWQRIAGESQEKSS